MVQELRNAEELLREISRKYLYSPKGWRVYFSFRGSYPTLLVSNQKNSWLLKFESPYRANPPGLGAELGETLTGDPGKYDFGLRPIDEKLVHDLVTKGLRKEIIESLLSREPVNGVSGGNYLLGPYYRSDLTFLSKKQVELERKLEKELSKLLSRRYPTNM